MTLGWARREVDDLLGLELDDVLLGAEPMPILLHARPCLPQLPALTGVDRDKARAAWGFDFTHRSRAAGRET